jgi:hypothetical protein
VVTSIAVVAMPCASAQTGANGYHGLIGSFKAYGFACVRPGLAAIEGVGAVRKAPPADDLQHRPADRLFDDPRDHANSAFQWSGPWTYNTGCPEAVSVFNTATTPPPLSGVQAITYQAASSPA